MASGNELASKPGLSSGEGLINEVRDPVENGAKVIDPGVEDNGYSSSKLSSPVP